MSQATDDLMIFDDSQQTVSSNSPDSTPMANCVQSSLSKVYFSSESFHFCMTQALTTEVEEIMGLLIGELDETNGHAYVAHSLPLKRLDKRKDRVEIGTEQLASAFSVVDELNGQNGKKEKVDSKQLQVVGWYHSHPHITVFPSEVDIATHHQYQSTMSKYWLGLIFSVFNYDESKASNRFQLIAFQSVDVSNGENGRPTLKHSIIPILIEPRYSVVGLDEWALKKSVSLMDLLLEEEEEACRDANEGKSNLIVAKHFNACVYSKAVTKIAAFLGAPTIDALKSRLEQATLLATRICK